MTTTIGISKHEGAGNDFLVMLDMEDRVRLTPAEVVWLADRHRGIGADGVITVTGPSGGGEVTMHLRNADGTEAEISGNGLRCLVHEVVRSGVVAEGSFSVMTGAGLRRVTCATPVGRRAATSADMGEIRIVDEDVAASQVVVDVGNPHVVVVASSLRDLDPLVEGAALQSMRPGGINVEWIVPTPDGLDLIVFERGVGLTLACGSGSCAAAVAARHLGLSGDHVTVRNPGGDLVVDLVGDVATLSGDVAHIADIVVPLDRDQ
jgi:diaminopimelate epimerase